MNQRVEDALEKLVSITKRSGNLRKDIKQDILVSVSVLRKEFSILKCQIKTEKEEQKKLREEVKNAKDELVRRDRQTSRQVAPSLDHMQQSTSSGDQLVLPSGGKWWKLYSEITKKSRKQKIQVNSDTEG